MLCLWKWALKKWKEYICTCKTATMLVCFIKNPWLYWSDSCCVCVWALCGLSPAVFCIYYISRGVLQENRQELVVFVLSVLGVMVRSVVNFSVLGSKYKQELLVGLPLLHTLRQHTAWGVICRRSLIMNKNTDGGHFSKLCIPLFYGFTKRTRVQVITCLSENTWYVPKMCKTRQTLRHKVPNYRRERSNITL